MTQTNVHYCWVRFYGAADWQIVKFWTSNGKDYLKGLDWMMGEDIEKFENKDYEKGQEIFPPNNR